MSANPACPNCGSSLTGPYCATCGQRAGHDDLTFRELLHETTAELTHLDGKVPRTLRALFLKPGLLTQDFLEGRRARWLPPLRLYLICSIAFFLTGPITQSFSRGATDAELAKITIKNPDGSLKFTPEGRQVIEQSVPGRLFGADRFERAIFRNAEFSHTISSAFPRAMFVLLPLFALFTNVAWRRRQPRYPAHLYFALHLHAAAFGAFAVSALAIGLFPNTAGAVVALAAAVYSSWYAIVAMHRVFGESWLRTNVKAFVISMAYGVFLFGAGLVIMGLAFSAI